MPPHDLTTQLTTYQETVDVRRTADQRGEGAELLCECQQDFIFIVNSVSEKRQQLVPRSLDAQGKSDRRQLLYRV